MIPIDDANTLNIKLFPSYPPPPPLSPQQVPLATVNLDALKDESWDLTMLRILPHIDGINSLKQIAYRADADYKLVRKAVEHLVYYGCVMLMDVWSFGACYAPTEGIGQFVQNPEMQEEGRRYLLLPEAQKALNAVATGNSSSTGQSGDETVATDKVEKIREYLDGSGLVELYMSLRQGQSLRSWCLEHADVVTSCVLDVRRFIHFGVVKGFLYRVHKYAIAMGKHGGTTVDEQDESNTLDGSALENSLKRGRRDTKGKPELAKYLDGMHCFDEICTELAISEKELLARLKSWGDVQVIYR
ncbi:MAG: hypothetical protein LQ340_000747 [Diploschistes diacapsis]|nr:MAG: hypothetical protein LQ340_000747 [Diploschistes diacapsis]